MHKLEFCLFALGNLMEEKDKDLSEKLLKLANESHYYLPESDKDWQSNSLYKDLFELVESNKNPKI